MSLSANFPTIRPSLLLDFANTQTLDPRPTARIDIMTDDYRLTFADEAQW